MIADATNQRFGYSREGYIYVLADPHMVLDIRGTSTNDGSKVILYHRKNMFEDNMNQLWDIIPAGQVRGEREVLFEAEDL